MDDFSDDDHTNFAEFAIMDDFEIDRLLKVIILHRDKKFTKAEAILLFTDEIRIISKGKGIEKFWNEKLALPMQQEINSDWDVSIPRKNLLGVGVARKQPCDCEECKKTQTEEEAHPAGFDLDLIIPNRILSLSIDDREEAFLIKGTIAFWLSDKAKWKADKKKKKK